MVDAFFAAKFNPILFVTACFIAICAWTHIELNIGGNVRIDFIH